MTFQIIGGIKIIVTMHIIKMLGWLWKYGRKGSSDENDLENALQHIEIFSIETYYLNRIFYQI